MKDNSPTYIVDNLSPLRYPGSKKKLINHLFKIIDHNKITPDILVEPFVGGGNVFLHFLHNNKVKRAIISDSDILIYSFWKVLFSDPSYLTGFIRRVRVNLKSYNRYKRIAKNTQGKSLKLLAKTCLFLNRTSFSGVLADTAGPIGGKHRKSKYKINCRFNKKALIKKIKLLSKYQRKVIVLNYDWEDVIKHINIYLEKSGHKSSVFYYFDPPFYHKADALYRCYFLEDDHKTFCQQVMSIKHDWILSYDNTPEVRKLYSNGYIKTHIEMPYSINSHARRLEKELIITPLLLPVIK